MLLIALLSGVPFSCLWFALQLKNCCTPRKLYPSSREEPLLSTEPPSPSKRLPSLKGAVAPWGVLTGRKSTVLE